MKKEGFLFELKSFFQNSEQFVLIPVYIKKGMANLNYKIVDNHSPPEDR